MQTIFLTLSALVAVVTAQSEVPARLVAAGSPSASTPLCMAAAANGNNFRISLVECNNLAGTFPSGNSTWTVPFPVGTSGPIRTFSDTKCLDVRDGDTSNGNSVQIYDCFEGNTNQLWTINSQTHMISWVGQNKCLDVRDGNFTAGNDIQIWDCVPGNTNQLWFLSEGSGYSGRRSALSVHVWLSWVHESGVIRLIFFRKSCAEENMLVTERCTDLTSLRGWKNGKK
ncbi:ricin B-like lectin [Marasmius fiardii PR-910]|nr:ricin B-like lectin [Marasmius fiardii PR-910]